MTSNKEGKDRKPKEKQTKKYIKKFTEENRMVNKHIKSSSTSLATREMPIKGSGEQPI